MNENQTIRPKKSENVALYFQSLESHRQRELIIAQIHRHNTQ